MRTCHRSSKLRGVINDRDDRQRVSDRADRVRLLIGLVVLVGVGVGVWLTVDTAGGCSSGDPQCVAHPYLGAGVALIVVCILIGLLTWLASIVLEAVLHGSDGPSSTG